MLKDGSDLEGSNVHACIYRIELADSQREITTKDIQE